MGCLGALGGTRATNAIQTSSPTKTKRTNHINLGIIWGVFWTAAGRDRPSPMESRTWGALRCVAPAGGLPIRIQVAAALVNDWYGVVFLLPACLFLFACVCVWTTHGSARGTVGRRSWVNDLVQGLIQERSRRRRVHSNCPGDRGRERVDLAGTAGDRKADLHMGRPFQFGNERLQRKDDVSET